MKMEGSLGGGNYIKHNVDEYELYNRIHSMPKVELHRHLEGSIRFSTLVELYPHHPVINEATEISNQYQQCHKIRKEKNDFSDRCSCDPTLIMDVEKHFCIPEKIGSLTEFMEKFEHTQQILATTDIIERVAFEACEDAALQNVIILELRYSPVYILRGHEETLSDIESIHASVVAGVKRAEIAYPHMAVGLIGILDRCSSLEDATRVTDFFIQHRDTFVGVDLANDEEKYDALHFTPLFQRCKDAGLCVTIHAGEISSHKASDNVEIAIERFGAKRIGHGIHVLRDETIVNKAQQSDIVFEVCPISNVLTGVVNSLAQHPIRQMLDQGLRVALSTDDPGLFLLDLEEVCAKVVLDCGLSLEELWYCQIEAYKSSFVTKVQKEEKWQRALKNMK